MARSLKKNTEISPNYTSMYTVTMRLEIKIFINVHIVAVFLHTGMEIIMLSTDSSPALGKSSPCSMYMTRT